MAQLPQRGHRRIGSGHLPERVIVKSQFAGIQPRPGIPSLTSHSANRRAENDNLAGRYVGPADAINSTARVSICRSCRGLESGTGPQQVPQSAGIVGIVVSGAVFEPAADPQRGILAGQLPRLHVQPGPRGVVPAAFLPC